MIVAVPWLSSTMPCEDDEPSDATDSGGVGGRVDATSSELSVTELTAKRYELCDERSETDCAFALLPAPFVSDDASRGELQGRGLRRRFTGLNGSPAMDAGRACFVVRRRRGGVTDEGRRRRDRKSVV